MIGAALFVIGTAALLAAIKNSQPRRDPRDDHWRNTRRPS